MHRTWYVHYCKRKGGSQLMKSEPVSLDIWVADALELALSSERLFPLFQQ
jgi:hypothetical protein